MCPASPSTWRPRPRSSASAAASKRGSPMRSSSSPAPPPRPNMTAAARRSYRWPLASGRQSASLYAMTIHMVKLCVGAEDVDDLADWQKRLMKTLPSPVHHTRMAPKRAEEMLDGGSIYWVIKRAIRVRQRIIDIRSAQDDEGRAMCER